MGYIILIGIVILIIYGIIKLIIWATPYIAKGLGIVLAVGAVAGLAVGVFFAIKNYMASIMENIRHKGLKVFMMILSSVFALLTVGLVFYSGWAVFNGVIISSRARPKPAASQVVQTNTSKGYITEDVHFQEGPSWNSRSLAILKRNAEVTVYNDEKVGNWIKIKYNDLTGYVEPKYLKETR